MSDFIVLLRTTVLAALLAGPLCGETVPLRAEGGHEIDPGLFRLIDVFDLLERRSRRH